MCQDPCNEKARRVFGACLARCGLKETLDLAVGFLESICIASRSVLLGEKSNLEYTHNLHQVILPAIFLILESHL